MKSILFIVCLLVSTFASAEIMMKINFEINGVQNTVTQKTKFDVNSPVKLISKDRSYKLQYVLSSKRPSDYPEKYDWTKNSVSLNAKIFDLKTNNLLASPKITTVLGKTATVEMVDSEENKKALSIKISFTPSRL